MKTILVTPHYKKLAKTERSVTILSLTNWLAERGFLPIVGVFNTNWDKIHDYLQLAEEYINKSDALILTGGDDIEPERHGSNNHVDRRYIPFRDSFELALIQEAVKKNIPIFGICRGMQLLNVFFGGGLYTSLEGGHWIKHCHIDKNSQKAEDLDDTKLDKTHVVSLSKGGILYQNLKQDSIFTNSSHNQGVDKVAGNFLVEGLTEDGLVEAISDIDKKILAVQWHPEISLEDAENRLVLETWLKFLS